MDWQAIFWLVAMLIFLMAEASTVSLISIWFAAGSLTALVAAMLGAGIRVQIALFLAVSAVLLLSLRRVVQRFIIPRAPRTNVDSVVGSVGIVKAPIDNVAAQGQVEIAGMDWSARSSSGEPIPAGLRIRVDRIEGVKVFVSPAEESASV